MSKSLIQNTMKSFETFYQTASVNVVDVVLTKRGLKPSFYNGGCGGIRTRDQLIKSQLRYHCATHPNI